MMIVWLVIKVTERVPIKYFIPLDVDIHEYKYIVAFMCSHESAPWSIQNQCNIRAECNNKLDFMPDCCITPDQRPPPPTTLQWPHDNRKRFPVIYIHFGYCKSFLMREENSKEVKSPANGLFTMHCLIELHERQMHWPYTCFCCF